MNIVVIGAGSITLGLLCPWLSRVPGARTSIVVRTGTIDRRPLRRALRRHRSYELRSGTTSWSEAFPHRLLEYSPSKLDSERSRRAIESLRDAQVVIVSVGTGNFATVGHLIARACAMPSENRESCGNIPIATSPEHER